uniref:Tyrosinase copper-binding domain-containing protein n=1 Tax=Meloidogyne enterolobii TaxID=390850 RepID=A0A6V7X5C5_MELEN|nr:unnamed protein product [Meloidogyne enterolobii]
MFKHCFCPIPQICDRAPDDIMKNLCLNMVDVMVNVSNFIAENPLRKGMSQDSSGDRPELKCLNQSCVCPYYGGKTDGSVNGCTLPNGQKVQKALRKEIRMISDEERNELFKAIRDMKDTSDYDYIAAIHKLAYEQGGAHMGAAFFSWHNEYCKRYEILVRKRNPSLALHYFDSTLDSPLPTPADSVLFTDEFFGTTNEQGYVTTGPFAPWETLEGNPYITRQVGQDGRFLKDDDIQWTLSQTKIENVMTYTEPSDKCPYEVNFKWIEYPHGAFHNCIGGDMQTIFPNKAANEVIFFFFHSHVNKIFVDWRQTRQTRSQRENDYPADLADCENSGHFRNATMSQFAPFKNIDGHKSEYTDNMYEYAPKPNCTATTDCGSRFLFCDRSNDAPRCVSKVRPGGNCKGFPNADICYNSTCVNDVCVVLSTKAATITATSTVKMTEKPSTLTPKITEVPTTKAARLTEKPTTITPKVTEESSSTVKPIEKQTTVTSRVTEKPTSTVRVTEVPTTQATRLTEKPITKTPKVTENPTTTTPKTMEETTTPKKQTPTTQTSTIKIQEKPTTPIKSPEIKITTKKLPMTTTENVEFTTESITTEEATTTEAIEESTTTKEPLEETTITSLSTAKATIRTKLPEKHTITSESPEEETTTELIETTTNEIPEETTTMITTIRPTKPQKKLTTIITTKLLTKTTTKEPKKSKTKKPKKDKKHKKHHTTEQLTSTPIAKTTKITKSPTMIKPTKPTSIIGKITTKIIGTTKKSTKKPKKGKKKCKCKKRNPPKNTKDNKKSSEEKKNVKN